MTSSIRSFRVIFQSTLPRGERRRAASTTSVNNNFNPRSHEGSDAKGCIMDPGSPRISIHAPTRGATESLPICFRTISVFQSTLPRGERQTRCLNRLAKPHISIHAPTRGATMISPAIYISFVDFNPRSHEGSDSNFTQNSISVLFHFYQSFPHIIFPHTARFRLLIIFCTFFLVRIAQRFPVCFHFAPKQYSAFYNVCSTDLL